jgi:hypothetical protein
VLAALGRGSGCDRRRGGLNIAAGVLTPGQPTVHELADGQKVLAELESRATVGKLALLP